MIVVADSGPPHYLILIGQIDLLHRFYEQVAIPQAVVDELCAEGAPTMVNEWFTQPPEWVAITAVSQKIESVTDDLDLGERAAIALAGSIRAGPALDRRCCRARGGDATRSARDRHDWSTPGCSRTALD